MRKLLCLVLILLLPLGALAEAVRASPVSMASINSSGPCP